MASTPTPRTRAKPAATADIVKRLTEAAAAVVQQENQELKAPQPVSSEQQRLVAKLEQADAFIRSAAGKELTFESGKRVARAREERNVLRQQIDKLNAAREKSRQHTRSALTEIERAIKKTSGLDDEADQLQLLLDALSPLSWRLFVIDNRLMGQARRRLEKLRNQSAPATLSPPVETAPDETEEPDAQPPPAAELEFDDADAQIIERLARREFDPLDDYRLNLTAQHLSLASGFEVLLCLPMLRHIEHYPFQTNTARQVMRSMRGRALLCDEVGLGKTIEAGLILKEYLIRGLARRVLVLVPPALVSQWREEMRDKFGVPFVTHNDDEFRAAGDGAWAKFDRVIASLHTAKSAANAAAIHALSYDLVIADEAHHLKNRATVSWKFVNAIKSKYMLLLTATPAQNNLDELFNLITLLRPGQLQTQTAFRRDFVQRGDPRQPKNRTKLRELMMDVMVRNTRSQVSITLPPRRATTLRPPLSPAERELYDGITEFVRGAYAGKGVARFVAQTLQTEAGSSAPALLGTLEKLRGQKKLDRAQQSALKKLCDMARNIEGGAKATALLGLLRQNNEKALVFTQYRETQKFLLRVLEEAGIAAASFSGEMSAGEKDAQVAAFADDKRVLVSTDVGSEGRNLQFCHTIVNYDLPWNPMKIEQRVGRVHRIGQTEPVSIFNLAAAGTVEDYVLEVLDSKINMFELVVGEVGEILGNLEEEREFEDVVLSLWLDSASDDAARGAFADLGERLAGARERYQESKTYDEELFGDEFVAEEA